MLEMHAEITNDYRKKNPKKIKYLSSVNFSSKLNLGNENNHKQVTCRSNYRSIVHTKRLKHPTFYCLATYEAAGYI